jgi:hypothetical protein
MQIKSASTGVKEVTDLQIQNSISHVLIVALGDNPITDEKMTLTLKTTGGQSKNVIPITKIRRPAVISQFGTGYQLVEKQADGKIKSAFLISISDFGAVVLENGDYLSLDLTDLDDTTTYSVFGLEAQFKNRAFNEYNSQVITGSEAQNKGFTPDENCKGIALSNNGSLASIRISYYNGNEVTYLPEELDAIMRNGNDVSFAADTLIEGDTINQSVLGGGTELWWLPLNDCRRFEVSTVGGTELTLVQLIRRAF